MPNEIDWSKVDWNRVRINDSVCTAVADNLVYCTGAFLDLGNSELGLASGTYVTIDDRLFLATCSHAVPDSPQGRLSFVTGNLENVRRSVYDIIGFGKAEAADVAYIELPPDVAVKTGKTPITLERIDPRGIGEIGRLAFVVGFPSELVGQKTRHVSDDIRVIDFDLSMLFYTNAPLPLPEWPSDGNPSLDLFLVYDREAEVWRFARNGRDSLANPVGTSGGGWWQGENTDGQLWTAERVKLFGIQSSWHEGKKYIRGCQIQHWLRLLYEHEPALQDTLRSAFPNLSWPSR